MPSILAPLTPENTLQLPQAPLAWAGWLVWLGVLSLLTIRFRDRGFRIDRWSLVLMAVLSVSILILTPFFGIAPAGAGDGQPHLMLFAALPWMIAGGMLGLVPAMMIAGVSGLLLAYLDTHHIFTPLLMMSAAFIFTLSIRQRYRTAGFRLLRFPLSAAFLTSVLLVPLTFLALVLDASGETVSRTLGALTRFQGEFLAAGGMVLIGGFICIFIWMFAGNQWGGEGELIPSPGENNLRLQFLAVLLPVSIGLLAGLTFSTWNASQKAARRDLVNQLTKTTGLAADDLQVFSELGNGLIQHIAGGVSLQTAGNESLDSFLQSYIDSFTFFDELAVVSFEGEVVSSVSSSSDSGFFLFPAEQTLFEAAINNIALGPQALSQGLSPNAVRLSFIVPILESEGQVSRVLIGRTDLGSNPHLQTLMAVMRDFEQKSGIAQIVDERGVVLYHTNQDYVLTNYSGSSFLTATYFESNDSNGGHVMYYYQPINPLGWRVIATFPVQIIRERALRSVIPLVLLGSTVIALVLLTAWIFLGRISRQVSALTSAAEKVSRGDFSIRLREQKFSGEVSGLTTAFQNMAGLLQSRIRKQSDLLAISERITGQLQVQDSLHVILTATLAYGVSSARIVLTKGDDNEDIPKPDKRFEVGKNTRRYAYLDEDVLALTFTRGQWVMREPQIVKHFHLPQGAACPSMILGFPLQWKNKAMGVFWLAYDDRRNISEAELDYLHELSKKASAAIINSKVLDETFTVRNRLESLLMELEDPVVVVDEREKVLFLNKAASLLPGIGGKAVVGQPVESLFGDKRLRDFLTTFKGKTHVSQPKPIDIELTNDHTYQASLLPLSLEGSGMGFAAVLKDVTRFTQRENEKSELVTIVSHELRSPLTLVQGYAKILLLTGNLNDQQNAYIGNIIESVEDMSALVQNLLDSERLDAGDAIRKEKVSIKLVMNKVIKSMHAPAKQKNITVTIDQSDESLLIEADAAFIVQALKNLLDNAIRYSKSGSEVKVQIRKQEGHVLFSVQDNGSGIAPLDQRKIFTRFFRSESQGDQDLQSGSGLGLAIVKSIAERHGGKVWFESKLGKGSTFYLEIPVYQKQNDK